MSKKNYLIILVGVLTILLSIIGYKYRSQLYRWVNRTEQKRINKEYDAFFSQWKVYGVDVSEYQESIDWDRVKLLFGEHKIYFTFIRATAGQDKVDAYFIKNWNAKKDKRILQGAYHYYRPNENSIAQAKNFIKTVSLKKGNLPPVLDIERISDIQSLKKPQKRTPKVVR